VHLILLMRNPTLSFSAKPGPAFASRPSCSVRFAHIHKKTDTGGQSALVPIRCKSWDCPRCRRVKSWQIKQKLTEILGSSQWFFLTLTYGNSKSAKSTWRELGNDWNRLAVWLRRRYPAIRYCRFVEPHKKRSYPHMHVLVNLHCFTRDFFTQASKAGFGWVANVKRVNSDGVNAYLRKYLTKEWPQNWGRVFRAETKCRIFSLSRVFGPTFRKKTDWALVSIAPNQRLAMIKFLRVLFRSVDSGRFYRGFETQNDKLYFNYDDFPADSLRVSLKTRWLDFGDFFGRWSVPEIHSQVRLNV